jgi:hypothetical protein
VNPVETAKITQNVASSVIFIASLQMKYLETDDAWGRMTTITEKEMG